MKCRLCAHDKLEQVSHERGESFFLCLECSLIQRPKFDLLIPQDEKARYEEHNNTIEDPNYLKFLSQALTPLKPYLTSEMHGLDWGCGPVKAIEHLLKHEGIKCDSYDPFFFPDKPTQVYDFIISTEVFEHFHNPHDSVVELLGHLKTKGYLCIMTELWSTPNQFSSWYYANDPTHVCFFHERTLDYLTENFSLELISSKLNRIHLFLKK